MTVCDSDRDAQQDQESMMTSSASQITKLLQAWNEGDETALEQLILIPKFNYELRRLAESCLRRQGPGHLLQPTALINEFYLRLLKGEQVPWQNSKHFFVVSAKIMRRILVDIYRKWDKNKPKRESIEEVTVVAQERSPDLVALDDALRSLAEIDKRKSQIVELRFFGGLIMEEVAEALKIPLRTVEREWQEAKVWLYEEISGGKYES